ncbi:MAG: hypothetical protein NVSMB56_00830 [Pyrinomonadaceae bacterium]
MEAGYRNYEMEDAAKELDEAEFALAGQKELQAQHDYWLDHHDARICEQSAVCKARRDKL